MKRANCACTEFIGPITGTTHRVLCEECKGRRLDAADTAIDREVARGRIGFASFLAEESMRADETLRLDTSTAVIDEPEDDEDEDDRRERARLRGRHPGLSARELDDLVAGARRERASQAGRDLQKHRSKDLHQMPPTTSDGKVETERTKTMKRTDTDDEARLDTVVAAKNEGRANLHAGWQESLELIPPPPPPASPPRDWSARRRSPEDARLDAAGAIAAAQAESERASADQLERRANDWRRTVGATPHAPRAEKFDADEAAGTIARNVTHIRDAWKRTLNGDGNGGGEAA